MPLKFPRLTDREVHERLQQALWPLSYCSGLTDQGESALVATRRILIHFQEALMEIIERELARIEPRQCVPCHEGPYQGDGNGGYRCGACGTSVTPEEIRRALAIKAQVLGMMTGDG